MYTLMELQEKNTESDVASVTKVNIKKPKRVIHFSDGVVEEYSDDEVDSPSNDVQEETQFVDPKTLTWGPWLLHKVSNAGSTTLSTFDYLGESLAWALGITSPKYYYELEEAKRMKEEKKKKEEMAKGWVAPESASAKVATDQPTAANL